MKRSIRWIIAVGILVSTISAARAQDTGLDLIFQAQRMQQWLSSSPNADGWRRFLLLNQLESQIVKVWRADPELLSTILRQFDSNQPGLDHPVFDGVRRALREHIRMLPSITDDTAAAFANADQSFAPVTAQQLETRRSQLLGELQACRTRYGATKTAAEAAALASDLRFDELQATLQGLDFAPVTAANGANKKQQDDLRTLRSILLNFGEKSAQQNDRFFAIVRRQLECVFLQYSQWLQPDQRAEFGQHLARLKTSYDTISDPRQRAGQGECGLELGWLDATGHAPQLVAAIRARNMLPNAIFMVAESFVRQSGGRPVDNGRPVSENILGRQIYGFATTRGTVTLDFVADPDQAHVSIHMLGNTVSDSHTHQGPITAFSGSNADVEARRSILANAGGIIDFPPYVAANLSSEFRGVNCIRLVEKLAYKQYLKDKDASEAIAARRTETKLYNEFRTQTDDALRQGRERLAQMFSENDSKVGFVPAISVRTTDDRLLGHALKTDTFQFSAPSDPPANISVPVDVVMQIHESMLDNYLEPLLARQTIKNVEFAKKFEEWFGTTPKGLAEPASDEIWGITFNQSRPVQFIFDGNRFGIAISGSKFTRDEEIFDRESGVRKTRVKESIDEPMLIKIVFQLQRDQNELVLVRDGRATVEFTRPGTKTVPKNAFRSFLEDVLNKNLREQEKAGAQAAEAAQSAAGRSDAPGVRIPANLIPADRLKDPTVAKSLDLVVFKSEQGWITAGWRNAASGSSPGGGGQPARVLSGADTPAIVESASPSAQ